MRSRISPRAAARTAPIVAAADDPDTFLSRGGKRWLLAVLMAAGTIYAFSQTLVGPALPALAARSGVSIDAAGWLFTGFLLSGAVATPLLGRLGDVHDRGRILVAVLVVFGVAGTACTLSSSFPVVLGGRVLQGLAGGVFPLAYGLLKEHLHPREVSTGIAVMTTTFGVGGGLGFPLAGVIGSGDVRWVFLPGLLALPVAVAAWFLVPKTRRKPSARSSDLGGTLLLSVGLVLLLLGLNRSSAWGVGSPRVVALVVAGLVTMSALVFVERRHPDPLIDLELFATRPVFVTNVATLLLAITMFANFLVAPQLMQVPRASGYGLGLSITEAGLLMLPTAVVGLLVGPLAARAVTRRRASQVFAAAALCAAGGAGGLALWHDGAPAFLAAQGLFGLGSGLGFAAAATLTASFVDGDRVGVATGINALARTVGGAVGTVLVTTAVASTVSSSAARPWASETGYVVALALAASAALLAAACCLVISSATKEDLASSP